MKALILMAFIWAVSGLSGNPRQLVYVKDCANHFIPIYADSKRTIPLANPFLSDRKGEFTFFTGSDCIWVKGMAPAGLWEEMRMGKIDEGAEGKK